MTRPRHSRFGFAKTRSFSAICATVFAAFLIAAAVACTTETVVETVVVEREVVVEVEKEVRVVETVVVEVEKEVAVDSEPVDVTTAGSSSAQPTATAVVATPTPQKANASVATATASPPTATPTPLVPPTPTQAPLREINFTGVFTSTNVPSQIQMVFALRDQDGHAVDIPAETVKEGIRVDEKGPGTNDWEEIDYSETSFFVHTAENIDLEVVFVLDFTNSMYEARLPDGRTGIDAMLDAFDAALAVLPSAHRIGVVEFHDRNVEPSVLSPLTTNRAAIRASVAEFANSGFDHGSSRVWDAVARGSGIFSSVSANPRAVRAMVFLSDGRDTSSIATRDSLTEIATERQAQLYALGVGDVFQPGDLRRLASATGGGYYAADNVSRLQEQLQLLVKDLRGQYQLTYITLRRDGEYRTRARLSIEELSAEVSVGPFDVASFFGADNQGVISHDPPSYDRTEGTADVFIRALHIPRNIDRIRFNAGVSKPVSVQLVGESEGGLLDGWALSGPDGSGFYEARSSVPIEFGNSGLLFKLTYSGIAENNLSLQVTFDSSIYTGGKQLTYAGRIQVGDQPRIAFTSDRDGDHEIYVMNADGSRVVQLTDNSDFDQFPRWSPDGTSIAFLSDRDGEDEIYVMNADGSGVVQLTYNLTNGSFVSWSPDGRSILYTSDPTNGDGYYGSDGIEIYVINADGSGVIRLTDNFVWDNWPSWSPDGRRIAFSSERDGKTDIYVMNADGSGVLQLTDHSASDYNPSWSSDGRSIAFLSVRDGENEIYVMNADGSGVMRLTDNSVWDGDPIWSPDGRRIAFRSVRDGDNEIYVMNADGGGVTRLTDKPGVERVDSQGWSPDGSRIVFRSKRDGDNEIYVMNADGSGVVQLTDNDSSDWAPAWSP